MYDKPLECLEDDVVDDKEFVVEVVLSSWRFMDKKFANESSIVILLRLRLS